MNKLRLNLGCGQKLIDDPEWLNVDSRKIIPDTAIFLRHDIRALKGNVVQEGRVAEILAYDVLEHFSLPEARQLLADCYAMLEPGGLFTIKTPEIDLLTEWANTHDAEKTAFRWYGGNDYPENCHRFCWPQAMLITELESLGFKIESIGIQEDTNIVIVAVKP